MPRTHSTTGTIFVWQPQLLRTLTKAAIHQCHQWQLRTSQEVAITMSQLCLDQCDRVNLRRPLTCISRAHFVKPSSSYYISVRVHDQADLA